jgi:hypothetical protein
MRSKSFQVGVALVAVAALVLALTALFGGGARLPEPAGSVSDYLFSVEDGEGTTYFSVSDAGAVDGLQSLDVDTTLDVAGNTSLAGELSVTGASSLASTLSVGGETSLDSLVLPLNTEHLGAVSVATSSITYTAGAGTSGTLATIADGEVWIIYDVFIQTTTTFTDTAGNDEAFTIGDGNDADGFLVASSTELASDFTEATGYAAGFYGLENGSNGAYTVDDGIFVYAPSGSSETIDYELSSGAGDDIGAGALTMYVVYMRIQ